MGLSIWRISTAAIVEQVVVAEEQQEQSLELLAEYHVYHKVHAGVDGHQQVGRLHQDLKDALLHVDLERLNDVDDQRQQVAHEEDGHYAHQHGC